MLQDGATGKFLVIPDVQISLVQGRARFAGGLVHSTHIVIGQVPAMQSDRCPSVAGLRRFPCLPGQEADIACDHWKRKMTEDFTQHFHGKVQEALFSVRVMRR